MASHLSRGPAFSRDDAARIVSHQELELARQLFDELGSRLATQAAQRFNGFSHALLTRNPENYGLYFVHDQARVPFLWLGLAWSEKDAVGTLPSWGASLEVDGAEVTPLLENAGGLFAAFQAVDTRAGEVRLHRFERHLELALWRPFDWLLGAPDQNSELENFWTLYLQTLVEGGMPAAVAAFIAATEQG